MLVRQFSKIKEEEKKKNQKSIFNGRHEITVS